VVFDLARNQVADDAPPEAMVMMVSRLVPWASVFPAVRARFAPLVAAAAARNDMWLSARDGTVLKWWLPVGAVLDALTAQDTLLASSSQTRDFAASAVAANNECARLPVRVTVSFAAVPPKFAGLVTLPGDPAAATALAKTQFLYSAKEASTILFDSSDPIQGLTVSETDALYSSATTARFFEWREVVERLESAGNARLQRRSAQRAPPARAPAPVAAVAAAPAADVSAAPEGDEDAPTSLAAFASEHEPRPQPAASSAPLEAAAAPVVAQAQAPCPSAPATGLWQRIPIKALLLGFPHQQQQQQATTAAAEGAAPDGGPAPDASPAAAAAATAAAGAGASASASGESLPKNWDLMTAEHQFRLLPAVPLKGPAAAGADAGVLDRWLTVSDLVSAAAPGALVAADAEGSGGGAGSTAATVDVTVQGVSLPGDTTLSWAYLNLRHPDLALYVVMTYKARST